MVPTGCTGDDRNAHGDLVSRGRPLRRRRLLHREHRKRDAETPALRSAPAFGPDRWARPDGHRHPLHRQPSAEPPLRRRPAFPHPPGRCPAPRRFRAPHPPVPCPSATTTTPRRSFVTFPAAPPSSWRRACTRSFRSCRSLAIGSSRTGRRSRRRACSPDGIQGPPRQHGGQRARPRGQRISASGYRELREGLTLPGRRRTDEQPVPDTRLLVGWWLQWVEVTGSSARGISLSDDMVVLQCNVVGNGRLGIGGAGTARRSSAALFSQNGLAVGHRGWEAGGIKATGTTS